MSHLKLSYLTLENFRTFKDRTRFDFKPITLLTGPNNSGKSSLIKALLLLQDNAEGLAHLDFTGGKHNLGSFENTRTYGSGKPNIIIEIGSSGGAGFRFAEPRIAAGVDYPRSFKMGTFMAQDLAAEFSYERQCGYAMLTRFTLYETFDVFEEPDVRLPIMEYNCEVRLAEDIARSNNKYEVVDEVTIFGNWFLQALMDAGAASIRRNLGYRYRLNESQENDLKGFTGLLSTFADEPLSDDRVRSVQESLDRKISISDRAFVTERGFAPRIENGLSEVIRKTIYHSPSGGDSKLQEALGAGDNSELVLDMTKAMFVPYLLEKCRLLSETLSPENLNHPGTLHAKPLRVHTRESSTASFHDQLHRMHSSLEPPQQEEMPLRGVSWGAGDVHMRRTEQLLKILGINGVELYDDALMEEDGLQSQTEGEPHSSMLVIRKVVEDAYEIGFRGGNGAVRSLADSGRGWSRLIPLILHLSRPRWGGGVMLEEPEAHLHPNLQSALADLFNKAAQWWGGDFPVGNIVVETHSEYLIRRLQYLVAKADQEAQEHPHPDSIVIHYFSQDDTSDDYVRHIKIDDSGRLSEDFGPGFLDEATNLMLGLYRTDYGNTN